jgi:phosphate-selective porin OprO/OprP
LSLRASARPQELPTPPTPSATIGQPSDRAKPAPTSFEELGRRLRAMEETNQRLVEELERTRREAAQTKLEHDAQIGRLLQRVDVLSGALRQDPISNATGPSVDDISPAGIQSPVPDYTEDQFSPDEPAPGYPLSNLLSNKRRPLAATFGPGFRLATVDDEYRLNVHLESQIEGRVWGPSHRLPPGSGIDGIYLPRQRIFFDGNITKRIEYELSINRGLSNLNLLNAYINIHFDDRFQLRFGRFFTPLPYDQYAISNYWLLTPERSLFTTNVGLNRQFGLKAWGYLLDERVDYAAGLFNGSRNSFENPDGAMDFVGYLNARPFQESESFSLLRFLNLGTSVAFGHQNQTPVPVAFRIGAGSPDTNIPGAATVPFLILDQGVIERGDRLLGSVHAAYFHNSLSLIGEWQYGFGSYATPTQASSTRVPFAGYYVAGGYFLTGEHVERRTRVYPRHPLIPTGSGQERGWGAWELTGRYSRLSVGDEIFTGGFADPSLWSDAASTTELGLNWYWNEYIKIYAFWLHGQFGDPIQSSPGVFLDDADMFWLRFQLYY